MGPERKDVMLSARLPAALVDRIDYVARNIDGETAHTRSTAVRTALEQWLDKCEDRLRELGVLGPKVRK